MMWHSVIDVDESVEHHVAMRWQKVPKKFNRRYLASWEIPRLAVSEVARWPKTQEPGESQIGNIRSHMVKK